MKKPTSSEALYATISFEGLILVPLKLRLFSILGVFLQRR